MTNLEDYVPGREKIIEGSLRTACDTKGPRIVVFRVSGTIALKAALRIREPYITLAGQTAPGGGVCVKDHHVLVGTNDVVIRFMRFRPGDEPCAAYQKRGKRFAPDALSVIAGARNVVIDHCSTSWAIDEVLSVSGAGITDVTVQWSIVSEALNRSAHRKGAHGYGSLLRCNGNVTFHHNLYAHHASRSPRPGTYGEGCILLDFRNNVIYNTKGYSARDPVRMNYIGNYIGRPRGRPFYIGGEATKIYVEGNYQLDGGPANEDNWRLMGRAKECHKMKEAFLVARVATDSAKEAYRKVLAYSGASLPVRDAVDTRIMADVRAGKGGLINTQKEVGGWPELRSGPVPVDRDRDGMPDAWEKTRGLNPADATDAAKDRDGDGYTNIEEFLNDTDPNEYVNYRDSKNTQHSLHGEPARGKSPAADG